MRILLVTDQYPPMVGGVPAVTHGLATDLAARGHTVWVAAPAPGMHSAQAIEQRVHVHRYASFEWPTYEGQRIALLPFPALRKLFVRTNPDIVHIQSPLVLGRLALLVARKLKIPALVSHYYLPANVNVLLATHPLTRRRFGDLTYAYLVGFYNRCDYITAPTVTAVRLLREHGLRAPAEPVSCGIDRARFWPGARDEALRRRLGLPVDRPLALFVNRLSREKRADVLLDAVARLRGDGYIAIAGSGPAEDELHMQARRLRIEHRVRFLGFVAAADLAPLYRLADAFLIPSEAELQSLATLEAMASGLPVLAANAYALPELVHHGENGFLFEPGNDRDLACRLDTLLGDPSLWARMGARSLEIVATHDRARVLAQWEGVYGRVAATTAYART